MKVKLLQAACNTDILDCAVQPRRGVDNCDDVGICLSTDAAADTVMLLLFQRGFAEIFREWVFLCLLTVQYLMIVMFALPCFYSPFLLHSAVVVVLLVIILLNLLLPPLDRKGERSASKQGCFFFFKLCLILLLVLLLLVMATAICKDVKSRSATIAAEGIAKNKASQPTTMSIF